MAEKKKKRENKQAKQSIKPARVDGEGEIKPGVSAYFKATWQLIWNWIKQNKLKSTIVIILISALVISLAVFLKPAEPATSNDDIAIEVSRSLGISSDGNPSVLTVEDSSKTVQPFLEEAQNGDKVLLFYRAGKAVLFRPSENRIVREGTFTPPDAKLFIRSGTQDETKAKAVKEKLKGIKQVKFSSQDKGSKRDYRRTVVVHVTDRYPDQAEAVAKALGAEIVRLPEGETIPDTDILVIVGEQ